jgi:hypothetical protein
MTRLMTLADTWSTAFWQRVSAPWRAYLFGAFFVLFYGLWVGGANDSGLLLHQFAEDWRTYDPRLTYGFDAPLAVLLMAGLSTLLPVGAAALCLSALLWGGVCALVARVAQQMSLRSGLAEYILPWLLLAGIALEPFFVRQAVWSPADAAKVLLTLSLLVLVRLRAFSLWTGLVAGLLVLVWLEAVFLALLLAVLLARRQRALDAALFCVGCALPVALWVAYAHQRFGVWLPIGVYTDVALYRHGTFAEAALRLSHLIGGMFGANFSQNALNWISGTLGVGLWLLGVARWGRRHTVVALAFWGTLAYAFLFMAVRTHVSPEAVMVPRLLACVLMFAGVLTVLEALARLRVPLSLLRGGVLLVWGVVFSATAWHAKAWITYYERMRYDIGTFIAAANTTPDATILAREAGAVARASGLHTIDWRGRTDDRVQHALRERAGSQLVRLLDGTSPDWLVLRDRDVSNLIASGYTLERRYTFMQDFELHPNAPKFLRDNPVYVVFKRRKK